MVCVLLWGGKQTQAGQGLSPLYDCNGKCIYTALSNQWPLKVRYNINIPPFMHTLTGVNVCTGIKLATFLLSLCRCGAPGCGSGLVWGPWLVAGPMGMGGP